MSRCFRVLSILAGVLAAPVTALAQEPDAEAARKERLEEMRRRAGALVVKIGEQDRRIAPASEPMLRFGDATRAFHDGALWIWSGGGRPLLMVSLERYEGFWSYELISLSDAPFTLRDESGWAWQPRSRSSQERPVPGSATPADSTQARLRQARDLSRRFAALEFVGAGNEKVHLRLQPRPIHVYRDAGSGLLDGAMFVFSNGTNPEMLLMLEAHKSGGPEWRYALAPVSTAPLEASLDGKVVWTIDRFEQPKSQRPYTYFAVPIPPEAP